MVVPSRPRVLFLCHGRLHPRFISWFPALNTPAASKIWQHATYIDIDPDFLPDVVGDVRTLPQFTFHKGVFDMIVAVNCPVTLYFEDIVSFKVQQRYWSNIKHWLTVGGVYVNMLPMGFLRPEAFARRPMPSQPSPRRTPTFLQDFESQTGESLASCSVAEVLAIAHIFQMKDRDRMFRDAGRLDRSYKRLGQWLRQNKPNHPYVRSPEQSFISPRRASLELEKRWAYRLHIFLKKINHTASKWCLAPVVLEQLGGISEDSGLLCLQLLPGCKIEGLKQPLH